MAVGTVSTLEANAWQLISSVTASGTSVDFTSISGYKTLMVVVRKVTTSASASIAFQCNSDTTNNYSGGNAGGTENTIVLVGNSASTRGGLAVIYDVDKAIPHRVDTATAASGASNFEAYLENAAITSIQVKAGGQTFTGGTVELYGIAA